LLLAVARHASLERTATVFENLDLTLADATIALFDAKYHYLVWRPGHRDPARQHHRQPRHYR
jgi:hypothetical protein